MRDLVIIGGGAASQAAAMYALGKQIDFLLVCDRFGERVEPAAPADRDYLVGNILTHFSHPGPEDPDQLVGSSAIRFFERQFVRQPGRVLYDRAIGLRRDGSEFVIETEHGAVVRSAAVILATGAAPRSLAGVAGSHLVWPLGHTSMPVGANVAGKAVAIIGASEQALYTAAELSRSAALVYLILPTAERAERPEVVMLQRQLNIEVLPGYSLVEAHGEGAIRAIVVATAGETLTLEVQAAFADLGYTPASSLVRHMVKTGPDGFIQVDRGFATSVSGLFAAGDVTRPEGEQVLAAIGDGARAARSAHFYLLTRPTALAVGQGR